MKQPERGWFATECMKGIGAAIIALAIAVQVYDCMKSYETDMISAETARYILDVLEGNIIPNK